MRFCPICESRMIKDTTTGQIIFKCNCSNKMDGKPEDTLMYEEHLEARHSNLKHEVFIENAPYDPAAFIIKEPCLNCSLPYLTSIRVGVQEQVIYVCRCGFKSTYADYVKERSAIKK
jgi:DNA-directed RNA polymerase subunit M/transcription elongation factor TFIIS